MSLKRKIIKYGLIGLFAILVLILLLLPMIAKNYVVNNSKELIGRQVDIDKLRINYFTGTLSMFGFKMLEANEKDVFTSFDTLIVNTAPYRYIGNVKALDQFYLEGLEVNLAKRDSTFNFDDLIAFYTTNDTTEIEPDEQETFKYLLKNLELKNANFNFYDADVDQNTTIDDFSFFIPEIKWDQEQESNADVRFNIADDGYIESVFNVHPKTGVFDGSISLSGLQLNSFLKYAAQFANINALDGTLNATIELNGNIDEPDKTVVSGTIDVLKLLVKDNNDQKIIGSEKINTRLKEIDNANSSFVIESIEVDQPYIKFELDSVSNNFFRVMNIDPEESESSADSTVTTSAESSPIFYAVNSFKINQGELDYTDNLTGQPFDYHLSEIKVDTDSILSTSEWVDITSDMLLNDRGTLKAELGVNPIDPMNATLDIAIEDFLLSDLNIYSNYYTGHSILVGDMFYFSDSKITNGNIDSSNHLLIKNVNVENNKSGILSIPLKLAVWLLKDKNGDIELDVPVAGDVNDPQVDTWSLIWTTLKNIVFNTTKNPVKSLARLVDADPKDLESVAFQYPDTIPNEAQIRQLDLILELEAKKEGLKIEMDFTADQDILKGQIAQGLTGETGADQIPADTLKVDKDLEKITPKELVIDSTVAATDNTALTGNQNLDSLANDYAEAVVSSVTNYLKSKQSHTQINVQKAKISDPDNVASEPQFKVKYTMREEDATDEQEDTNVPNDN